MGKRSCDARALKEADHDYLREEPGARTRDPYMAGKIADARMRPVRIVVSERRLDHLHARDVEFERYRSTVRALRHGWVPGASYPYEQPPRAWAPSERRALERDVARERSTYGYPY